MPQLVLVSRDALEKLIAECYDVWAGRVTPDIAEHLHPSDPIVTLAVEAAIRIPGPMAPGTAPPAPPLVNDPLSNACAQTFRHPSDHRLRCADDGKVVYTSMGKAEHAASRIAERQAMRAYLGRCGHYHVSRVRHHVDRA